jgi:hypothetical protein
VENAELEEAINELEVRLERLRALYEQYFLGIEKLEPQIPRKDVDRRIWILRRERVRNTAKRFKLQTLIQRYNTFQQHWQRICREIENGTYKRHLIRVEKQFGPTELLTIAARKRFGRNPAAPTPTEQASAQISELMASNVDAKAEAERAAAEAVTALDAAKKRPPKPIASPLELDFGDEPAAPKAAPTAASTASPNTLLSKLGKRDGEPAAPAPAKPAKPPLPKPAAKPAPSAPKAAPPPAAPAPVSPATAAKAGSPKTEPKAPAPKPPEPRTAPKPEAQPWLDETRLSSLHQKLLATKKQNNERGTVTLDKLGQSLRDTEAKLRAKHGNRKIEFDVVVKDGKAVVKPILK